MHNFLKEQNLDWRDEHWYNKIKHGDQALDLIELSHASVQTELVPRDKEQEVKDFHQAQLDISKDILPKQAIAEKKTVDSDYTRLDLFDQQWHKDGDFSTSGEMKMTPTEAFTEVYPSGKDVPQSAAMLPTTSLAEYPASGYRGDDGVPQGKIGSLQLETKGDENPRWIGDHYLPKQCQDGKDTVVMPNRQVSSAADSTSFPLLNLGDLFQKYLEEQSGKLK